MQSVDRFYAYLVTVSELFFRYFSLSLFKADQRVYIAPTAFTTMEMYIGILELHLLSK